MGFEETDYVYKITVDGTDIREYYDLETKHPESEVREQWLSDAVENHGRYIQSVFAGRIQVELLTEDEGEQVNRELENGPIPLPPPDNDKLPE